MTDCNSHGIAYVVGVLNRFTSRLGNEHWRVIKRVMRYLIETKNCGVFFKKYLVVLGSFCDAEWNTL